jgi:hypothetical protein
MIQHFLEQKWEANPVSFPVLTHGMVLVIVLDKGSKGIGAQSSHRMSPHANIHVFPDWEAYKAHKGSLGRNGAREITHVTVIGGGTDPTILHNHCVPDPDATPTSVEPFIPQVHPTPPPPAA